MRKWMLVGVAVLCMFALGGCGEFAESIVDNLSEQIEGNNGGGSNTDNADPRIYQVGEPMTFNMKNGGMARVTITGWEKKYEKPMTYDALSVLSAKPYLIVNYEVENVGDETICVNDSDFDIYADNYAVEQSYWEGDSLFGADLAPGRKESGLLCGDVDSDNVSNIEIQIANVVVVLKDESVTQDEEDDADAYEDEEGSGGEWDVDSDTEPDSNW